MEPRNTPRNTMAHALRPSARCATCCALVSIIHPSLTLEGGNVPLACLYCGGPVADVRLRRLEEA